MSQYARLSSEDAHQMLLDQPVNIVDIRDADSFQLAHITEAVHLDNTGMQSFINDTNQDIPLIVCCYHGNMSQSAGAYLAEKGFAEVYSLDGGFAEWASRFPDDCEPD
ncbi:thiosulfate sulfurtransferase GlpE [Granulosicoccus antarcticus]|nr:thiosulfate sulfurtransferase GlpE [Granulosicoccus antarcticus]